MDFYRLRDKLQRMLRVNLSWRTALMSALLAFGVFAAVRFLFNSFFSPSIRLAGVYIGLPLGAFLGGYWAGLQSTYRAWLYGLIATGALMLVSLLFSTLPSNAVVLALTLAGGPLGGWLAANGGFRGLRSRLRIHIPSREERLFQQLVARLRQDAYMAERLIDYERRRNPNAPRARLIQDALDRLNQDRR